MTDEINTKKLVELFGGNCLFGGSLIQFGKESFEEMYRQVYDAGMLTEREACAKLCESMWHEWLDSPEENEPNKPDAEDCYRAIRRREQE